jgi:hypothetical protein
MYGWGAFIGLDKIHSSSSEVTGWAMPACLPVYLPRRGIASHVYCAEGSQSQGEFFGE